ncbi:MAG: hypothetical protein AAGH43_06140 [Pseudomonadota bacterium]
MSALVALRSAIVADLRASVSDARTVEAYGGKLNLGEINRVTTRAPAILIAIVNGAGSEPLANNQLRVEMLLSAFVIAEDKRGQDRDVMALSIAEQVIARVALWSWTGIAKARQPEDVKFESLYSGDIDRRGVALLAVAWKQSLPIGIDRFTAERDALDWPEHLDPDGLTIAGSTHGAPDPEAADA